MKMSTTSPSRLLAIVLALIIAAPAVASRPVPWDLLQLACYNRELWWPHQTAPNCFSVDDIHAILDDWNKVYPPGTTGPGDYNWDGVVDQQDLDLVLRAIEHKQCCSDEGPFAESTRTPPLGCFDNQLPIDWYNWLGYPANTTDHFCLDFRMLEVVLENFGMQTGTGDLSRDGTVDFTDLNILMACWGECWDPEPVPACGDFKWPDVLTGIPCTISEGTVLKYLQYLETADGDRNADVNCDGRIDDKDALRLIENIGCGCADETLDCY